MTKLCIDDILWHSTELNQVAFSTLLVHFSSPVCLYFEYRLSIRLWASRNLIQLCHYSITIVTITERRPQSHDTNIDDPGHKPEQFLVNFSKLLDC